MSWLTLLALYVLHVVYYLVTAAKRSWKHVANEPLPLLAKRDQVPAHLALLLASRDFVLLETLEDELVRNVELAVSWCRAVGIKRLTVYDRRGILAKLSIEIRGRLLIDTDSACVDSSSESEIEYPLTPPLTDDSRSLSPEQCTPFQLPVTTFCLSQQPGLPKSRRSSGRNVLTRRRPQRQEPHLQAEPFTLHIISRDAGKSAISDVTSHIIQAEQQQHRKINADTFTVSIDDLDVYLEGEHGFPSPDFMIVHDMSSSRCSRPVLELEGYPPWHVRLTEFYYSRPAWRWHPLRTTAARSSALLDEAEFRRALDQYAAVEKRLGK